MTMQRLIPAAVEPISFCLGVIIICLNISCNEQVVVYETMPYSIVGHWEWVQSLGMSGLVTPETAQRSTLFIFNGDGTFYRHIMYWGGDTIVDQSTYRYEIYSQDEKRGTLDIHPGGRMGGNLFFVTFTGTNEIEIVNAGVEPERTTFKKRRVAR
uniref:Uncharacterized protein n=1 Tax=Citrobacter sp. JEK-2009 TaxID=596416 RepID=B9WPW6_9ENTR|nr:hypothetical protein [Citrobacter sp. JEK-2009]